MINGLKRAFRAISIRYARLKYNGMLTPESTPLMKAIIKHDNKKTKKLIKSKFSVLDYRDGWNSALSLAVELNDYKTVKMLVDSGVYLNTKNRTAWSVLNLACFKGYEDIALYLAKNGAYLESTDPWHSTPLIHASGSGLLEVVKYLVDQEVLLDSVDNDGEQTALIKAAKYKQGAIVQYLTEHEINIYIQDKAKLTALDHAKRNNDTISIKALKAFEKKLFNNDIELC